MRCCQDGPVVRITLDRPQKRNALSIALSDELIRAIADVQESATVKVLVIQGAGETFCCAADDITEMHSWGDANGVMRRVRSYQMIANALEELDKVTVAAVDGFAVGGGLEITMAPRPRRRVCRRRRPSSTLASRLTYTPPRASKLSRRD